MDFCFVILHFRTPLAVNAKDCMKNNEKNEYRTKNVHKLNAKIYCIFTPFAVQYIYYETLYNVGKSVAIVKS